MEGECPVLLKSNYVTVHNSYSFSLIIQSLFGKEADKLEHANDDDRTYYLIEKDALVNKFISIPKDKGSLNCAAFSAGIIEGILNTSNFVSTNKHKVIYNLYNNFVVFFSFVACKSNCALAQGHYLHDQV